VTEPTPRRRGSIPLYALAFALLLGAGAALVVASLGSLRSTRLLWLSGGLSCAAVVCALASVLIPGRAEP
jgi:hypothetical protein